MSPSVKSHLKCQGQRLTTGRGENAEQEVLQIKTDQWLRTSVCVERFVTLACLNWTEKIWCSRKILIAGPADNTESFRMRNKVGRSGTQGGEPSLFPREALWPSQGPAPGVSLALRWACDDTSCY